MFEIPQRGFARSINQHNVRLDALCDWLEGGVLFQSENQLAASDVVDLLMESNIYEQQEFAWNRVEESWSELRNRARLLESGYPIDITNTRLHRRMEWQQVPAHSLCLALSFAEWYPDWARAFGQNYTEQGELFELLTEESLRRSLDHWEIHRTGWTKTSTAKLGKVVGEVAAWLGEPLTGNMKRWKRDTANDAGLDILCFRPMPDRKPGVPLYLLQCASGIPSASYWNLKLRTPDISLWAKLIDFAVNPKRAFATPFAFQEDDFLIHCRSVDGMFFDRYRLLAPARMNPDWLPQEVGDRIVGWITPRIATLPTANS